jgi:hypothetical protein
MAQVFDVIHDLTYQANTSGLDKAIGAIEKEITAIDKEAASVAKLEELRAKTDKANITRIAQINQAIDNRRKKITELTATITKEIQVNDKLRNSLAQQGLAAAQAGDRLDKFKGASNSATLALSNLGRVAQDAPFGFIGIANNLNPLLESFQRLRTESGSNAAALKALGSSLIGAGGLGLAISVVSSLLVVFGDKLFRTADAADAANDAYKDFLKTVKSDVDGSIRAIREQSNEVERLFTIAQKGGANGANAIRKLREEYPDLTKSLTDAELQAGKGEDAILRQVKATEAGNLAKKEQVEIQLQLEESEKRLSKATEENARAQTKLNTAQIVFNNAIGDRKDAAFNVLKRAQDDARTAQQRVDGLTVSVGNFKESVARAAGAATAGTLASGELNPDRRSTRAGRGTGDRADSIRDALRIPDRNDLAELERDANNLLQLKHFIDDIYGNGKSSLEGNDLIGGGAETPESRRLRAQLEIQKDVNENAAEDDDKLKDKRKQNLKDTVEAYKSFSQAIGDIINELYERQIQALSQEIEIRTERVRQAEKLAERGNAEILRLETERLEAAEKLRRDAAQRQIAINAALALSNAIVAVATTAAESGVASVATIPAVIAALVAGYSFVRSLDTSTGFKDGVVDLDGPGTTRSDSIPARLSRGESVINAEATKKWKPLLEDINAGREPSFIPVTRNFPTTQDQENKLLRREIAMLRTSFESQGLKVENNVTNGHIALIVEHERKLTRRMFAG